MCFHKFFLARFSKFTKLPFPAITCASHSIVATSLISQFHDFFKLILAGFCYLPQLTIAAAQCCHSPAMGLNNAHCFRGMSKLKCSAVLHSLDESWLLFLPEGLGRDCVKLDFFFFRIVFQLLVLLHCSFILEISLQPLLGIYFLFSCWY